MKGDQCLRPTGGRDKFNGDRIRTVDLHDCTQITSPQAVGRYVMGEYDNIKRMNGHFAPP